ncbi:MAG: HNH endonuclease signature motif containing protein [Dehalococcoidia bacterium]
MTPRRWGTNTRAWAYRYLVLRDGEACSICHAIPTTQNPTTQNRLDIDHIDGNFNNTDPDNLRLLCRTCNVSISNKSRPRKSLSSAKKEREKLEGCPATRIAKEDANYRAGSPEMQANLIYEVAFRRWVMARVTTQSSYDYSTAINEGAETIGCSPLTTTRYLAKLTSPAGPLTEIKDALGHRVLILKPHLQNSADPPSQP